MSRRLSGPIRMALLVAVMALVGVACAGNSDESGSDPLLSAPYEVDELAIALRVSTGGDEVTGGVALLVALDRGYDLETVAAAAFAGELTADGVVVGDDDEVVEPQGSDTGFITDKAALSDAEGAAGVEASLVVFAQPDPLAVSLTTAELGDRLRVLYGEADAGAAGGITLSNILRMLDRGFSLEQVLTAVIFGETETCEEDDALGVEICTIDGEQPENGQQDLLRLLGVPGPDDTGGDTGADTDDPATPDPDGGGLAVYEGAFGDIAGLPLATILDNKVVVEVSDAGTDIVASFRARFEPDFSDRDPDVMCEAEMVIEIESAPDTGAVPGGDEWTAATTFQGGVFDGTCSAGSQDNVLESTSVVVALAVSGSSLTGSIDSEGAFITFAAELVG